MWKKKHILSFVNLDLNVSYDWLIVFVYSYIQYKNIFYNIYTSSQMLVISLSQMTLWWNTKTALKGAISRFAITKIKKNRIPKESPTQQNWKCCRLDLIELVHGRYWKVQVTVHHAPSTGLSWIQHFTRKN
jgi:hypothetical protein